MFRLLYLFQLLQFQDTKFYKIFKTIKQCFDTGKSQNFKNLDYLRNIEFKVHESLYNIQKKKKKK